MLKVYEESQAYFDEVEKWAEENGILDKFEEAIRRCDEYADHEHTGRVEFLLYRDFAPHSFGFTVYPLKDGKRILRPNGQFDRWFNGGLIYQGPECPADGSFPSLTVTLGNPTKVGWFMHT